MELQVFTRFVGAGLTPLLGSDTAPTTYVPTKDSMVRALHSETDQMPVKSLAVTYIYTGIGVAPVVTADAYIYDSTTRTWLKLTTVTLTNKVLTSIQLVDAVTMASASSTADHVNSIEIVWVPKAAGGEPDGTYTFGSVFDIAPTIGTTPVAIVGAIDTELPAAAALSDAVANPTTPTVGAAKLLWDAVAATWRRAKVRQQASTESESVVIASDQIPLAAALTDAIANPTTAFLAAANMAWDATAGTWRRMRVRQQAAIESLAVVIASDQIPLAAALSDAFANPTTATLGAAMVAWDATAGTWRRAKVRAQTSIESLAVVLATDQVMNVAEGSENDWVTIRPLAATVDDGVGAPVAGSFVSLTSNGAYLRIKLDGISAFGGTVAPSQVRVRIWNMVGAGPTINEVGSRVFDCSRLTAGLEFPVDIPWSSDQCFITLNYLDGTAPTSTGNIKARRIATASSGLTNWDLPKDPDGIPLGRGLEYDPITGGAKVNPQSGPEDRWLSEVLIDTSGASYAVTTYTYDVVVSGAKNVAFSIAAKCGTAADMKIAFYSTKDSASASPTWTPITAGGYDASNDVFLSTIPPVAYQIPIVATAALEYRDVHFDGAGAEVFRCAVQVINAVAGNSMKITCYKCY